MKNGLDCVSSKYTVLYVASYMRAYERTYLSLRYYVYPQQLVHFSLMGPVSYHASPAPGENTWRYVAYNLFHSLTASLIYFLHFVFPLPHASCSFLIIFFYHII